MKERSVRQPCAWHFFIFLFVVTCSVTLLCPGSASAAKRKSSSSSSSSSSKVSPSYYPEEDEPLIDQIAMESNDNAQQAQPLASVVAPPSRPVGYTGFKINPNCRCGKSPYKSDEGNPQPWTAAIFYKNEGRDSSSSPVSPVIHYSSGFPTPTDSKTSMLLFCTGSLINDRYVLTASRCVQGLNSTDLEVWLSDKSIWTDHYQPLRSLDENRAENPLKKIAVEKIIIHPDFTPSVLDHEIALLRLADPVKLSRRRREGSNGQSNNTKRRFYTTPICLPKYDVMSSLTNEKVEEKVVDTTITPNEKSEDIDNGYIKNLKAIVSAWEKKGRTSYSLVQTEVPVVKSINKCLDLTNQTAVLNENMLCAGKMEENAIESCSMDTGSPLVIYEDGTSHKKNQPQERIRLSSPVARRSGKEDTRGHYTLVGVSSWLYGCTNLANVNILYDVIFPNNTAKPQVPGVYHRIEIHHPPPISLPEHPFSMR